MYSNNVRMIIRRCTKLGGKSCRVAAWYYWFKNLCFFNRIKSDRLIRVGGNKQNIIVRFCV